MDAKRKPRPGSLGHLVDVYLNGGPAALRERLQDPLGIEHPEHCFAVVPPRERVPCERRAGVPEIAYESANPKYFAMPYVTLLAHLKPAPPKELIYHPGEEIIWIQEGKCNLHLYGLEESKPGSRSSARRHVKSLSPGDAIRINPQLPHHACSVGGEARTWVFMRHLRETSFADTLSVPSHIAPSKEDMSRVAEDRLKHPAQFGMIAFGVSDRIRGLREHFGLSQTQLANSVGITKDELSKIERRHELSNPAVKTLREISRHLNLDLQQLISIPEQAWLMSKNAKRPDGPLLCDWREEHLMHLEHIQLAASSKPKRIRGGSRYSSLVVIDGNATLEIEPSNHPHYRVQYRGGTEYVAKGYVVHLRHHPSVTIAAQTPCRMLHLTYGDVCPLEQRTWARDRG